MAAPTQQTADAVPTEWQWLPFQLIVVLVAVLVVLPFFCGPGIPSGRENNGKAAAFIKEKYPSRSLTHSGWRIRPGQKEPGCSDTDAVAVVFHLIRSGTEGEARQAIDCGAENRFGNAAPYVIERLGSTDARVRKAARAFLVAIADKDYGPSVEAWRAWWRNPPVRVLGIIPVGQKTLAWMMPLMVAFAAVLLWAIRRLRKGGPRLSWHLAGIALTFAWFTTFVVAAMTWCGGGEACTFGAETIHYHQSHGTVLGLEDARAGGGGLFFLLMGVFFLPFVVVGGMQWLRRIHGGRC